jgi:transporter family-2 protein
VSHPAFVVLILAVGVALAVQAAMNAKIGATLASPLGGALVNFVVGLVLLVLAVASGMFGRIRLAGLSEAPWWAYLGGAIGAAFVTISVVAVPRVGAAVTFAAVIAGQLIGALLLDSFGWLEVTQVPLNPWRLMGAVLLIAGVVLIQQK